MLSIARVPSCTNRGVNTLPTGRLQSINSIEVSIAYPHQGCRSENYEIMDDVEGKKSKVSMLRIKSQSATRSQMALGPKSTSRLKVRRPSYGFSGVPGIRPVERSSQLAIEFKRPPLSYLPTYQLTTSYAFHLPSVTKATDELLDENFTGHKYNVQESPALALRIAGELMRKIKAMQFNRYRIITVVTIAQKRSQSYNNAISFLWDHERDNYVNVQREVSSAFIQVTAFGVYFD